MSPILGIWASSQQPALNASSYESIATTTVGAGGSSTITFSSISSTYKHLQIRYTLAASSLNTDLRMQFNSDTGANYTRHYIYGTGGSAVSGATTGNTYNAIGYAFSSNSQPYSGVVDILNYSESTKYKTTRSLSGTDENSAGSIIFFSGLWMNTNAVTSITLSQASGNFAQYSTFALYGIKG